MFIIVSLLVDLLIHSFSLVVQLLEININSGKPAQARKHLSNNRPLSVKCNTMDCTVYRAWFVGKDLHNHDSFDICIQMTKVNAATLKEEAWMWIQAQERSEGPRPIS